MGWDPFTGKSELVEGGLWKRSISLYGLCVRGIWRRGSFIEAPESYMQEGSGDEHHLFLRELYKGYLEGGSLLVTSKDMLRKALELGVCFHRGPLLGNM
jgi:hypothetical protein